MGKISVKPGEAFDADGKFKRAGHAQNSEIGEWLREISRGDNRVLNSVILNPNITTQGVEARYL